MRICADFDQDTKKCKFVKLGKKKYGCEGSNITAHEFWYASCVLYNPSKKLKGEK